MKKLILILSVLLLVACGCLAVVLHRDLHLSDIDEIVLDKEENWERTSEDGDKAEQSEIPDKVIEGSGISYQIMNWKMVDTIKDADVDLQYVFWVPDDGVDAYTEEDYVDWDVVYEEKPLLKDKNENPDKYSMEEEIEIYQDAVSVIEENTHYKNVHYDFLLVECTVCNLSEEEEKEFYVNSAEVIYTKQDDGWVTDEAIYFDHLLNLQEESECRYVLAPKEELAYVIGYRILEEDVAQIRQISVGFPRWIEGSDGLLVNPSGQSENMIRIQ